MTLTDFLLARIAEDEAVANRAPFWADVSSRLTPHGDFTAAFAERMTPARVLAECEAKRRIVQLDYFNDPGDDWSGGSESAHEEVLTLLALPYADHPDYREEWKP